MIEAIELTSKGRGRSGAGRPHLDRVSFDVYPGQVTALLGAPGVGKSSVLRMMTQQQPAKGRTLFGGRPYRALRPAVREVGLSLDPDALHPGRTVRHHLALYGAAGGVPRARVGEVLEIGGLTLQAHSRCGELDPAQRQRLGIAAALLGDPAALILDEPHALDAHGLAWFHALIRAYAAQGRTVLVAASDPATLAGTADHVVVLRRDEADGRTRVIASRSAAEVFDEHRATAVIVRSPQAARLAAALEAQGATLASAGPGALEVRGLDRARIGEIAHTAGICLHELAEAARDDALYGIEPPRKAIAPAPIEIVEAEDVAVGVTAGPRSGWRSGVRLIGSVGGTATIEEAEVVEPAEGDADGTGDGGLSAPPAGRGGGLGAPPEAIRDRALSTQLGATGGSALSTPREATGAGAPSAPPEATRDRAPSAPPEATRDRALRTTPEATRDRALSTTPEANAAASADANSSQSQDRGAPHENTARPSAAVPSSPPRTLPSAAPDAAAASYAAELAAAYAQAFAEDEAADAQSPAPHTTPSVTTTRTPEEAPA